MSHMPTTEQPGAISLLLQQVGVSIGAGPFRTLNFHAGATVVDAGNGVAQIDVSGGGGGSIPDGSVTLAKLADMAQSTFIGRHAGGETGVPEALTAAQVKTALAIAAGTDVSGLAAIATTGAAADLIGAVALGQLATQAQATFVGRAAAAGTGVPSALTAAQAKTALAIAASDVSGLATVATTGSASDITAGTLPAAQIGAGSLALSKLANQATATVLGNNTGGAGAPIALTAAQTKTLLAIVPGDVTGLAAIASSGSATDLAAGSIPSARYAANTMVAATFAATATQRVLGRNTAGAGQGEEVTASQLFDWVSSTNGALLTRTGGTWAALANVTSDNGDLQFAENTSPVAPATGLSKVFGSSHSGRQMPAFLAAVGDLSLVQPFKGTRAIAELTPVPGTATFNAMGITLAATGTITARALANTNLATGTRRAAQVSSAVANSVCGYRPSANQNMLWRGNAAGAGGFHLVWRNFMISDAVLVTTANMFVGIQPGAAPTDVDPATLVNLIGVGCTNGDTVMQLYAADATARTKTSLGVNFPVNTINTDLYEFALYAPPNGSDVRWQLKRVNTGDKASGTISASANMPLSNVMLAPQAWRSNGGTAAAVGLDLGGMYLESDK